VHNEEQGHEEARNQYKWETLHQTRVVKRAEQDCIQEIGDAEQVLQKVNRRNRFIAEGAMKSEESYTVETISVDAVTLKQRQGEGRVTITRTGAMRFEYSSISAT
jgi:hypothetical protein